MRAYFTVNEYIDIPVIPEINYNDLMDGSPDNMPFSFTYDEDLTKNIKLKDKCIIRLEDDYYKLYHVGHIHEEIYTINNIEYTYLNNELYLNNVAVAQVYDNNIIFYDVDEQYIIDNNKIYKDKRKYYYMCVSQITSEKLSTNYDNGYMITVLVKEQTILLKDCIRTDIAISPSLYPEGTNVFQNLYDATLKVIDCHNMCLLNDTITNIDDDVSEALKQVACPNLTYRDLSTYSQLYDIFMRIGRIPYYSNGTIYGIKLQGNRTENTKDLSIYSSISNIVEEGVNDNIYSSKIYNNLYDKEFAVVPNIFSDLVNGYEEQIYSDGNYSDQTILNVFLKANTTSTKAFTGTSADNLNNQMDTWLNNQYSEWKRMTYNSTEDLSKCLLFVNGFDDSAQSIEDARSYNIELPYPIERVESVYLCKPRMLKFNQGKSINDEWLGTAHFGFGLQKIYDYNDPNIGTLLENTYYEQLSNLQKASSAYYVRGGNKINSIISLLPFDGIFIDNKTYNGIDELYKEQGFSWSSSVLFNELKSSYFVVKYKPILNTTYTNYEYVRDLGESKPLSINNFNLPYSQVSDKQVYPVLEYNLQKGLDDTYNLKFITTDSSILDVSAGDIVKYQGVEYIVSKMQSYINNVTIECSFELNDKIIQNSILSSYKDNVRVSSNISAESSVDRPIHIFAENVVELYNDVFDDGPIYNNIDEYNIFTQKIGQNMINATFYKNGLYDNIDVYNDQLVDAYGNLSQYPLRFSQIRPEGIDSSTYINVTIHTKRGLEYGNNPSAGSGYYYKRNFTDSEFPIAVCLHYHLTAGVSSGLVDTYYVKYIANNRQELTDIIPSLGAYYYKYTLVPTPYSFINATFITNATNNLKGQLLYKNNPLLPSSSDIDSYTYYDIRPSYTDFEDGDWNYENLFVYKIFASEQTRPTEFKYTGKYSIYDSTNPFSTSNYGTEKFISNTGLLTKLDYCMVNSGYANSVFNLEDNPLISLESVSDGTAKLYTVDAEITQQTPLRYNDTKYGCLLEGIGKTSGKDSVTGIDNFYSFSRLPHLSNKGYYLDLRENPRAYIQYKTRGVGTRGIIVKELSNEFEWMSTVTSYTQPEAYTGGAIYTILKFTNIENAVIDENNKVTEITNFTNMHDNNGKLKIRLDDIISYNTNYDYLLVLSKDSGEKTKLIKFNFSAYGNATNVLGLSSTVHSNYD